MNDALLHTLRSRNAEDRSGPEVTTVNMDQLLRCRSCINLLGKVNYPALFDSYSDSYHNI
ncbi:hypothetical protein KY326_01630 [Candidatus Woesearchaeota archaeon]|nr:hypothetical protein [Candidatus Woesearchaeota archaeon]